MRDFVTKVENLGDKYLSKVLDPLLNFIDRLERNTLVIFPPDFEYRYNKLTEEFVTVPVLALKSWDKEYLKACKKAKVKP